MSSFFVLVFYVVHLSVLKSKMLSLSVFMRGSVKFPGPPKPKTPKCPLSAVRKSLRALRKVTITWREPPNRIISAALQPFTHKKLQLSTLLSHNLIWNKVLDLLSVNLNSEFQSLLKMLRRNKFSYQMAVTWLHLTYFNTPQWQYAGY